MAPGVRGFGSAATWIALGALGTFAYGVEHWRSRASARANRGERERFHRLAECLLGHDGDALVYAPGEARRRLRALAMATPLTPAPTWLDRCVPLARDLAVHGSAVDVTGTLSSVPTHVGERARELALALAQVGLAWQVRAGDPDTDMDRVADLLTHTAAEIGLASARPTRGIPDPAGALRAPVAQPFPRMAHLGIQGLVPLPLGTPGRFLVGAPLPLASTVSVSEATLRVDAVANVDARYWRYTPQGLVRIVAEEGASDGLAPVLLDGPAGRLGSGRIAGPPRDTDRAVVALDAASTGGVLWLAEAVRGQPPTLCRLAPGTAATAARLAPAPVAEPHAPPPDEEVAVGTDGPTILAAFTRHTPGLGTVLVSLVRAVGGARAAVEPMAVTGDPWTVEGRHPRLAFCQGGTSTWLFAAGRDGWRAGLVRARSLVGAAAVHTLPGRSADGGAAPARHWDETLTVRCVGDVALAYGRERPRASPLLLCRATPEGPVCTALPAPPSPQPVDLALFATEGLHGERTVHAEWPFAAVPLPDGAVVAARAAGTMVAVTRLDPGATRWRPERVVLDAAADEHGSTVRGVELYAAGPRVLLVTATAGELRAAATEDGGGAWELP